MIRGLPLGHRASLAPEDGPLPVTRTQERLPVPPGPALSRPRPGKRRVLLRIAALLALLYLFLVAIGLLESSFRLLAGDSGAGLFENVRNPFVGLLVGILGTVLVQSSSVTTATIVALVGSGQLPLGLAVPMVMGANIGTTVTNTLVSIGSVRRTLEFRRAFACATLHDLFNILSVAVLLPLELYTGVLERSAIVLGEWLGAGSAAPSSGDFSSPVKVAVKAGTGLILKGSETLGAEGRVLGVLALGLGLALIFASLTRIMNVMKALLAAKLEASLNRALDRSGLAGIAIGAVMTIAVQSSSITTSMLVPLAGAGLLSLRNAYPILLGCNLGTTGTALIASAGSGSALALDIALVHLLFNLAGTVLFYGVPGLRALPVYLADRLSAAAARNRIWLVVYALLLFVVVPLAGIALFR